jgi:hypothetical protein
VNMHCQGEVDEIPLWHWSPILFFFPFSLPLLKKTPVWQLWCRLPTPPLVPIDGVVEVMCRAQEVTKEYSWTCTMHNTVDSSPGHHSNMQHICWVIRYVYALMDISFLLHLGDLPLSGPSVVLVMPERRCSIGGPSADGLPILQIASLYSFKV